MALVTAAIVTTYLAYASAPQSRQSVANHVPFTPVPIPGHQTHELRDAGRIAGSMPVPLPVIDPRQAEPASYPWDVVGGEDFMPQGDRFTLMNRPHLYFPSVEVPGEPARVQRDPLYPDDLRAYDLQRSRAQKILAQSSGRNYQIGRHHIPYNPRNATHQEVSQDPTLAGRMESVYTSGSQDKNGPILNTIEPFATTIRGTVQHIVDDRSSFQPQRHSKRQRSEYIGDVIQAALPQSAVIHHPTEWVTNTKLRSKPKYLNPGKNLHGFTRLSGRDQRGEIHYPNPMKKKRLLLLGDQGFVSSQAKQAGHLMGLEYAPTPRKREILPPVEMPGLYAGGGTGFAFRDQNTGNGNRGLMGSIGELQTREPLVSGLTPLTHVIGLSTQHPGEHTFVAGRDDSRDMRVDNINQYTETAAWHAMAQPTWQSDEHTLVFPHARFRPGFA